MDDIKKTLVCRHCQIAPKLVKEEGRDDTVFCPNCGNSGGLKVAIKLAGQYASRKITDDFRDRLARSTSRSKSVSYVKGNRMKLSAPGFIFK